MIMYIYLFFVKRHFTGPHSLLVSVYFSHLLPLPLSLSLSLSFFFFPLVFLHLSFSSLSLSLTHRERIMYLLAIKSMKRTDILAKLKKGILCVILMYM